MALLMPLATKIPTITAKKHVVDTLLTRRGPPLRCRVAKIIRLRGICIEPGALLVLNPDSTSVAA
jgi:hypothetical protein